MDDFQLLSMGRLDAYSVKWERHPEPFTLHRLISHSDDKPSLIAQLADGWTKLSARASDRHVVVHLVTNAYPSTRGGGPLAHFWTECWKPRANQEPESPVPTRWQEAWEKIQVASGLAPDEFRAFARDCRLDFQFALPEPAEPTVSPSTRDRQVRLRDVNAIGNALFRLVADPRHIVEIPRNQLIEELGWHGRLELRHPHEFPEPAIYQEIEPTVDSLKQSLEQLAGGYILLLGTPGSGKSTLLTQTLKYRQERSIRYYAFVPQAQNINRGESENFLHDITLMLAERGFRAGQSLQGLDRVLLAERFDAQLRLLHEKWTETGRRTILLIDGLDHIPREQSPARSLLADLPSPSRVPDGVYILLGSQTDQLRDLPSEVVDQIQQPERRITMEPLGREAVLSIVSQTGFNPTPTAEEKDRIYQLSGGHPLALAYLLNRLRTSGSGVSKILTEAEPFPGRIDAQYTAHWRQIQSDRELVDLLAMLARVRGGIEIPWVEKWASQNALYRLYSEFSYYFRQEASGRWCFFHNSFRIFLLEKTERLPGISSSSGAQSLYGRLADVAASAGPPWSWDEVFYRVKAGEEERALELATLSAFREQLFAGRAWSEIREDLELLLPLPLPRRDVEDLARLLFIGMEIEQRAFNLDEYADCPIPELLLRLGKIKAALSWSREGLQGRLEAKDGLRFAAALAKLGLKEEAGRAFDLSEPLDILGSGEAIPHRKLRDKSDLLKVWVEVAPAFRDIPRLLRVIGQIRCEDDGSHFGESSPEDATRELQGRLRYELLRALQKLGRWSDHARVISCWDPAEEEDRLFWFWGHIHAARKAWSSGQKAMAVEFVENLLSQSSQRDLTPEDRIPLSECLIRVLGQTEEARDLLNGVSLQPLSALDSLDLTADEVVTRFYFYRVRAFLGDRRSLSETVPDARNRSDQGITLFERAILLVARLWAAAWANRLWPASEFGREAENVLRLLFRRPDPGWHSWYQVQDHRGYFCRTLIGAARLHGPEALEALRQVFEQEWTHPVVSQPWPLDLIRECALELLDAGAPKFWVASWCEQTGTQALDEKDVPERLKHLASQVRSWLDLDDKDRAQAAFDLLMHRSLGVHTKETQTNSWIAWAERANEEDPSNASRRLQLLASGLPDLEGKEVLRHAARDLLKAAWRWKPGGSLALFEWMLRQGLTGFADGLQVLIAEGLKSEPAAAGVAVLLFGEILLPLMRTADEEFGRKVVESLVERGGGERGLAKLVDRVLIAALGSKRRTWIDDIQSVVEKAGIPWDRIAANVENQEALSGTLQSVHQADLERSSSHDAQRRREEAELRKSFQSFQDVEAYLAHPPSHSSLSLEDVLVGVLERFNTAELVRLAELIRGQNHLVSSLNQIAKRLLSLGATEEAWKVGELALGATEASGWIRRMTGGTRVETFSVLHQIDPDKASGRAFQMLLEDLRIGRIGFSSFGFELHRIAPLLGDNLSFQKIWGELEPYVKALFPLADTVEPSDFGGDATNLPESASVLGALVVGLINHPIADIGHGAQRIVVDLLRKGETTLIAPIASALSDSAYPRQRLLTCLEAVAEENPEANRPFLIELQGLALSPHFDERAAVSRLLSNLGVWPLPKPEPRKLPAVYDLAFPERDEPHLLRPVEADQPLPPTEDPVAISMIIRGELGVISDFTGIQMAALYNRVAQLVRDPLGPDIYEEERELRKQLESAGLRIPFRRPRTDLVRAALFLIVAELADAGRLDRGPLKILEGLLRYTDPMMFRLRPHARPLCIPSILPDRDEIYRRSHEDWTSHVSLETSALRSANSDSNWVILAEQTCLSWLDWPRLTENRYGVVVPSGLTPRPEKDFLGSLCQEWSGLASEYEQGPFNGRTLIVRRANFRFESPAPYFLAFNPAVARALGWTFVRDGHFRWRDSDGNLTVESLWWQDGCPHLEPPESSDEVGEGWLVRASLAAWQAIQARYTEMKTRLRVERTANEQETRSVEQ